MSAGRIQFAQTLADKAGDIALRYYRKSPESIGVTLKADQTLVTLADVEIEETLKKMIAETFPDDAFHGEETEQKTGANAYRWVIDPIDGTTAFAAGFPTFTNLIALLENDKPLLGIVNAPFTKERWVGAHGKTTYSHDGKESILQARGHSPDLSQVIIGCTHLKYFKKEEQLQRYKTLEKKCKQSIHGGDAYMYAQVASGHVGIAVDAGLKIVDVMAVIPVLAGTGASITDWSGNALEYSALKEGEIDVLVAATAGLRNQAVGVLCQA